ncbi:MAG: V4R domain-containing protein [Myxococcota bacterium]
MRTVSVPDPFAPLFEKAEDYVSHLFSSLQLQPDQGTIRVGDERYILMRAESFYLSWYDSMAKAFGDDPTRQFIYNTAREIGRSDSASFSKRLGVNDPIERLSSGPIHFAHAGWARVEILPDSTPAPDSSFFLHYCHPNAFEAELYKAQSRVTDQCVCLFSAGYSAGWCSDAFGIELHGREIKCVARGDERCEFIMAPAKALDGFEAQYKK